MNKPKRGRPPLPDGVRKGFMMRIRMTDEERTAIDKAALKDGSDSSTWVRQIAVAKAKKILASDG